MDEIKVFLEMQNCRTIINCTALADIEKCESDPEMAYWINCELPGIFSSISKSLDFKFVHISTDAVFDGTRGRRQSDFQRHDETQIRDRVSHSVRTDP